MDRELQEYFETLVETFNTRGWQTFLQDMHDAKEAISVDHIKSTEEFWRMKGQAEILGRILRYQETIEATFAEEDDEDVA